MINLSDERKKINDIDTKLASLFDERMQVAKRIAEYKKEYGLPVKDKAREDELKQKLLDEYSDDETRSYYSLFIDNMLNLSCSYQSSLLSGSKVAYCGEKGAFAYFAAQKIFPTGEHIPYPDFSKAYDACVKGECDCALLPIENSNTGEVRRVVDMLLAGKLVVSGIYDMPIDQCLMGIKGSKKSDIKKVISHHQALSQCDDYIIRHGYETEEVSSTSLGAKMVSELGDIHTACIANEEAAKLYNLEVLEPQINEQRNNTTRFAVFTRSLNKDAGKKNTDKFILTFTVKNEAGSLSQAISIIASYGYNMRCLRSRPMKDAIWNYYFYCEIDGAIKNEEGQSMLKALGLCCKDLKIAGIFE